MTEGEHDSFAFARDLYHQQVFCCTNSCTIQRYSLQLGNNIPYLIIFHVKTVTRMARTLECMNRMARSVTRMARKLARMTRMARWLAH